MLCCTDAQKGKNIPTDLNSIKKAQRTSSSAFCTYELCKSTVLCTLHTNLVWLQYTVGTLSSALCVSPSHPSQLDSARARLRVLMERADSIVCANVHCSLAHMSRTARHVLLISDASHQFNSQCAMSSSALCTELSWHHRIEVHSALHLPCSVHVTDTHRAPHFTVSVRPVHSALVHWRHTPRITLHDVFQFHSHRTGDTLARAESCNRHDTGEMFAKARANYTVSIEIVSRWASWRHMQYKNAWCYHALSTTSVKYLNSYRWLNASAGNDAFNFPIPVILDNTTAACSVNISGRLFQSSNAFSSKRFTRFHINTLHSHFDSFMTSYLIFL